ncbi:MAG: hypothetical protein PHD97_12420 [Bacteroidales bacterium]|nr:hypothetical protein [Bacteroidales bacterium]
MFNKKKSGFYYSVILIIIFLFLNSCKSVYIPNAVNAPFLTEKKQGAGAVCFGTSYLDGQAAYSFAKNFAAMMNFSYWHMNRDSSRFHRHFILEGGGGYYTKLNDLWVFDVYACFGIGNSKIEEYGEELMKVKGNYTKVFVQPSIGIISGSFEGGFSLRSNYVYFTNFSIYNSVFSNPSQYYIEPVITGKAGFGKIKFTAQLGCSLPFGSTAFNTTYDYQNIIFNLGVCYKFYYPPKKVGKSVRHHRDYLGL